MNEITRANSDEEPKMSSLLDPEHPLLENFQKVLKEHLALQIENLKSEIHELEAENKQTDAINEELGITAYETQQFVCKEQKQLDEMITELKNVNELRSELENTLTTERKQLFEREELLSKSEKDEKELQNEIEAMNLLIKQITEWESKMESDIVINKRISEKTRKDHLRLAEEKKFQDMIIYRLLKEISKFENEVEVLKMQIAIKMKEEEEFAEMQTLANINAETLETEYKSLVHSWNSVIVAVENRDKVVECLNSENHKIEMNIKSVLNEIDNVKKLIKDEMMNNEYITAFKNRNEVILNNNKKQLDNEINKKQQLEQQIYEKQAIVERLEKDLEDICNANAQLEKVSDSVKTELKKLLNEKLSIEKRVFTILETQFCNNSTSKIYQKHLYTLKMNNNNLEISVVEAENKHQQNCSAAEMQQYINKKCEIELQDFELHLKEMRNQLSKIRNSVRKCETEITIAERDVERLNLKIDDLSKSDSKSGPPQKTKIQILEKHIDDMQEDIRRLQSYWLREQVDLITKSKERQNQINSCNLMKKQLAILTHKNLNIKHEIETISKQQEKVSRNIDNLMKKFDYQCEILYKKRGIKINLNEKQDVFHLMSSTKLKECEIECLNLESEITDIEDDKVRLSKELLDCNRESLEWDKKVKLAYETKQQVFEAKSKGGEIELMKQEIHRMEVRHSQLIRAQEKLSKDLELCILRRGAIYMESEAKQKRDKTVEEKIQCNFTRKLDDIRNQITELHDEIDKVKSNIKLSKLECANLKNENGIIEDEMSKYETIVQQLKEQIEIHKTNRELKFELLLMAQKKLNMCNDLIKGRTPYTIYRTESQLTTEYNEQKDVNNKLCSIVENLTMDFPQHHHMLTRFYNSLKIPTVCIV